MVCVEEHMIQDLFLCGQIPRISVMGGPQAADVFMLLLKMINCQEIICLK